MADVNSVEEALKSPFTVGALGALVALKFAPGTTWWERFSNVVCGMLLAGYLAPALVEWLNMKSQAYASGAAFLFGLVGMSLAAALLQGIRDTPIGQILTSWLSRKG